MQEDPHPVDSEVIQPNRKSVFLHMLDLVLASVLPVGPHMLSLVSAEALVHWVALYLMVLLWSKVYTHVPSLFGYNVNTK